MSGMSEYLEGALLSEVFRDVNFAAPATWVALFTADPTDAGALTAEITGNNYSRVLVNKDGATAPFWNDPIASGGGKKCDNQSAVAFPVASGAWGTITFMAIFDAVTGGNCLFTGPLLVSKIVGDSDQLTFPPNTLVVSFD
jgi:hypothetical protein